MRAPDPKLFALAALVAILGGLMLLMRNETGGRDLVAFVTAIPTLAFALLMFWCSWRYRDNA